MKQLAASKDGFEVPLTPLIDVVFLLLIFFLVATTFSRKEYDQQVDLPGGAEQEATQAAPEDLLINIRHEGTLVVQGRVVTLSDLPRSLQRWQATATGGRVLLRADTGVDYGEVVKVMALCRNSGVQQLGLPVAAGGQNDE